MSSYLRVRNWERFQHYKNRRPLWIKFYVELLDDEELTALPETVQLVYDRLLLLAAKHDNAILNDSEWIAKQTRLDPETITNAIPRLLQGRWLSETRTRRRASKLLAARYQDATPEKEKEKETPTPFSRSPKSTAKSNGSGDAPPAFACPRCGVKRYTEQQVTEHLENVHPDEIVLVDAELAYLDSVIGEEDES